MADVSGVKTTDISSSNTVDAEDTVLMNIGGATRKITLSDLCGDVTDDDIARIFDGTYDPSSSGP